MTQKKTATAHHRAHPMIHANAHEGRAALQSATAALPSRFPVQSAFLITLTFALIALLSSCTTTSKISKNGLSYVKINDSMPRIGQDEMEGHSLSESQITEEGYTWRVCTLAYRNGQVLLESDFQERIRVNRIRVETPELQVKGGLKVGDSLADLLNKTPSWEVRPYAKYQLMECISAKYPRLVFLIRVDGFDYSNVDADVSTADLPGESEVVGIVVL